MQIAIQKRKKDAYIALTFMLIISLIVSSIFFMFMFNKGWYVSFTFLLIFIPSLINVRMSIIKLNRIEQINQLKKELSLSVVELRNLMNFQKYDLYNWTLEDATILTNQELKTLKEKLIKLR